MKNSIIYTFAIITIVFLFSCKKDSAGTSKTAEVQYQFTSTIADQYRLEYADNGSLQLENFTGTSWTKTINLKLNSDLYNPNIARIAVYPPASWINTSPSANVGLKIFVNSLLRSSIDTVLKASDKNGIFIIVSF